MFIYLLKGVLMGLMLSVLVGPIFVSLLQAGLEGGRRAGFVIGAGIWLSDLLFILVTYFSLQSIAQFVESENQSFKFYVGLGGALILISIGLATFFSKSKDLDTKTAIKANSYASYFTKGFLINTVNPFTLFFWIGVSSGFLIDKNLGHTNSIAFYLGIFGTIILTDISKIMLAHLIRKRLKPKHLLWVQKISGLALIIFGIILFLRVL